MDESLRIQQPVNLEHWLSDKPPVWSQFISIRAALRVLPVVVRWSSMPKPGFGDGHWQHLIIMMFRLNATNSAAIEFDSPRILRLCDPARDSLRSALNFPIPAAVKAAAQSAIHSGTNKHVQAAAVAYEAANAAADAAAAEAAARSNYVAAQSERLTGNKVA